MSTNLSALQDTVDAIAGQLDLTVRHEAAPTTLAAPGLSPAPGKVSTVAVSDTATSAPDAASLKNYRMLFNGPVAAARTFASQLATRTQAEVHELNTSKYIGETEKNLTLFFAQAEQKNWILLFDEGDALFGKRTSVKDSHDKYANQEVSNLLQQHIEQYAGAVILATNKKADIDSGFLRRFHTIIHS